MVPRRGEHAFVRSHRADRREVLCVKTHGKSCASAEGAGRAVLRASAQIKICPRIHQRIAAAFAHRSLNGVSQIARPFWASATWGFDHELTTGNAFYEKMLRRTLFMWLISVLPTLGGTTYPLARGVSRSAPHPSTVLRIQRTTLPLIPYPTLTYIDPRLHPRPRADRVTESERTAGPSPAPPRPRGRGRGRRGDEGRLERPSAFRASGLRRGIIGRAAPALDLAAPRVGALVPRARALAPADP